VAPTATSMLALVAMLELAATLTAALAATLMLA
jgi:hypothetical protein